ncbi:MAG: glycosyltransferase [Nitrospirota bacterium]
MISYRARLFYAVKPFIPRRLQILLRRALIAVRAPRYRHVWPINERSNRHPDGWTGWPEQKRFALVLMHDVETERGQGKCRQLMQLEQSMSVRSSFNFVPERYAVSSKLRQDLGNEGFEIGVHGLKHDGKLFLSRKRFDRHAARINQYLKEWRAVGFVSPSMHRNLDWMHELEIEYDTSTFDTDPFEPQPDGVQTIFPFAVQGDQGRRGYVELPYTLPQDFTLFVLMRETNIDIWKRKLDWIADNGGMALLITHPDYMADSHAPMAPDEYPMTRYRELLEYVRSRYDGQYWNPLPREIARFWRAQCDNRIVTRSTTPAQISRPDRTGGKRRLRACMVAYTFYDTDNRVKRYAETLKRHGADVDVIALRKEGEASCACINGVDVSRVQKRVVNERGALTYLTRLLAFLIKSTVLLTGRSLTKRYDLIHVHNVPDFQVFAALVPKLAGSKIILDIHDILPEFYASKFSAGQQSIAYQALLRLEKWSTALADHVIISNHLWEQRLVARSVKKDKCTTIMNYPDPRVFSQRRNGKVPDKFIMIYPGTLNWHQGVDIAVRAFALIKDNAPHAEFHIYGDGPMRGDLQRLISDLGVRDRVFLRGALPSEEIAMVMAKSDLGVVPKRNDSFGGDAFSTKIFEFMALGVPVVVAETRIDRYYFDDTIVRFFEPENAASLAMAIEELVRSKEQRDRLAANAAAFVSSYTWDRRENDYLSLVGHLVGQGTR